MFEVYISYSVSDISIGPFKFDHTIVDILLSLSLGGPWWWLDRGMERSFRPLRASEVDTGVVDILSLGLCWLDAGQVGSCLVLLIASEVDGGVVNISLLLH